MQRFLLIEHSYINAIAGSTEAHFANEIKFESKQSGTRSLEELCPLRASLSPDALLGAVTRSTGSTTVSTKDLPSVVEECGIRPIMPSEEMPTMAWLLRIGPTYDFNFSGDENVAL